MTIKMIVATGANFEIGQDGKLPWGYIKEDMQYFQDQTSSHIVVMGRKTQDSLSQKNKTLPRRINYVVSSEGNGSQEDGSYRVTMEALVSCVLGGNSIFNYKDTWIIGGASIYQQLLPYVDEIHWTLVEDSFPEADTYFDMSFLQEGGWEFDDLIRLNNRAGVSVWKRK
ncbi:dihydrofolate reductase [Shewanella sp. phage 1/40]|uniref:dihydrofolate reductase n=1 Tax=Shewanella sp. phage 1/40 TaxID=1458860 RepID=UPI0004F5B4E9|nr:dihydrofolate reductase [Shewanella sp. phage 1/40]AHK11443.1 dihydrofolate reductase [Shewanella sp. phage 1/40]